MHMETEVQKVEVALLVKHKARCVRGPTPRRCLFHTVTVTCTLVPLLGCPRLGVGELLPAQRIVLLGNSVLCGESLPCWLCPPKGSEREGIVSAV